MTNPALRGINAVFALVAAAGKLTSHKNGSKGRTALIGLISLATVGPLALALAASTPEVTITCTGTNSCTASGTGFTPLGQVLAQAYAGSSDFSSTYLEATGPSRTCITGPKPICITIPGGIFKTALPVDHLLACDATAAGSVKYTDVSTGAAVSKPITWTGPCGGPTTTTLTIPSAVDTEWTPSVNPAKVTSGSTLVTSGTITITVNGSLLCAYTAGATSGCTSGTLPEGTDQVEASYSDSEIPFYDPSSALATVTVIPPFPSMPATGPNWAGYVAVNERFTAVSASWTVPKANCGTLFSGFTFASSAATWVGIDGTDGSNTVEQIGTDSDCVANQGEYHAWWQMFPGGPTLIGVPAVSYVVHAGDSMTASVTSTGTPGWYTLQIADSTQGWNFVTTQFLAAATGTTAECIEEQPAAAGLPLTNFGSVTFNQCRATGRNGVAMSIWDHPNEATDMSNGSTKKATVSPLSNDGTTFTVTWLHN